MEMEGPKGGISIDSEVLCGCVEGLTDSVALLFSVFGATQQFVGAFLPDTSGTIIPLQQEDKDPLFYGCFFCVKPFISCRDRSMCSCAHACVIY